MITRSSPAEGKYLLLLKKASDIGDTVAFVKSPAYKIIQYFTKLFLHNALAFWGLLSTMYVASLSGKILFTVNRNYLLFGLRILAKNAIINNIILIAFF